MRKPATGKANKERTVVVFCGRCNLQVEARVVATHVRSTPENPLGDACDTPCKVVEYAIAACNGCESIFLVESEFYEIPGEVVAPQGERVLYPAARQLPTEGFPARIAETYSTAAASFVSGLYEPCVIMCRKCVEVVCRELGATKGSLEDRLKVLADAGQIDGKLLEWADRLRLIGNDAAHNLDAAIEQVDARDALDFLEAILMYTFYLSRRFEEFQRRQQGSDNRP